MLFKRPHFQLTSLSESQVLLERIKEQFPLTELPSQLWEYCYYDTFDSRLYRKHQLLRQETRTDKEDESWLCWLSLTGNRVLQQGRSPIQESVIQRLPSIPLRSLLEPILHPRALFGLFQLSVQQERLVWKNKDDKIILRLMLETTSLVRDNHLEELQHRLVVIPFRGYPKPFQQINRFCLEAGLVELNEDLFQLVCSKISFKPGSYQSKPKLKLSSLDRADQALRKILRESTKVMDLNYKGTIEAPDTEFLHDFRVACRRARSALNQLKGVFPAELIKEFREDFSLLSDRTGPTRDLDVYLLNFSSYQCQLPEEQQADLEAFRNLLLEENAKEQKLLAKDLQSNQYQKFRSRWETFLTDQTPSPIKGGAEAIRKTASKRLFRSYHRCLTEGKVIEHDSPDEALHDLRKSCKKLRYLLEFFESLWPAKEFQCIIKPLKALQEDLGQFNDCSVQQESLKNFGDMLAERRPVPAQTLVAMGMLVSTLNQRQSEARERFVGSFAGFASTRTKNRFNHLLEQPSGSEEQK
jgi:CHAD domain-containing protein